VVVLELGVVELAPLPEGVESLLDSDVELGLVPLSAERLHAVAPNRRAEPTRTVPRGKVSFRMFMTFL